MAIGFQEGFGGPLFSMALVLACVVRFFFPPLYVATAYDVEVLIQVDEYFSLLWIDF